MMKQYGPSRDMSQLAKWGARIPSKTPWLHHSNIAAVLQVASEQENEWDCSVLQEP